jgi:large subunit ribosomal protein L23
VRVQDVRTLITPEGEKKAFVKLTPDFKASDLAVRLGIL